MKLHEPTAHATAYLPGKGNKTDYRAFFYGAGIGIATIFALKFTKLL